jgi:twinkle protein
MTGTTGFPLGKAGVDFLESRKIDIDLAVRHLIHTVRADSERGIMVPDIRGTVLAFPFVDHGKIASTKYRGTKTKKFWQAPGGTATFYGADIMDDPAIVSGEQPLTIVEGELDKLSVETAGNPFVVSVPEGAPPPSKDHKLHEERSGSDEAGKFRFMWNNRERLVRIKRFVLAVDDDAPGKRLADELIRRLLASRCLTVKFPEGYKDPNAVLMKFGGTNLLDIINSAKLLPISGVYSLSDYPERDFITYRTGLPNLDPHFLLFEGQFFAVTGIPGHGKSLLVTQIAIQVAKLHGWNTLIYSPEMPVIPMYRERLRKVIGGTAAFADAFINRHIRFIDHPPIQTGDDGDISVDEIIRRTAEAVLRDDIRLVLVDPWNEVEHDKDPGENISDYVARNIRNLRHMAQRHKLSVGVVAHPTKDFNRYRKRSTKEDEVEKPPQPTLYDIESCNADDTEVLTKRGWLHHGQVTTSDDVACFDLITGAVVYHQPSAIHRYEHCGEMIEFCGCGYDLLVTSSHRMVVKAKWPEPVGGDGRRGRPRKWIKDQWYLCSAGELSSAPFSIPLAGSALCGADPSTIKIGPRSYPMEAFCRLVGWYISEGCFYGTGLTWSQNEGELAEKFTATFEECGIPASVGWMERRPDDGRGFGGSTKMCGRWYIGNRFCRDLVAWFHENCGADCYSKRLPESVFDLSSRLKRVILDSYIEGDGCWSGLIQRATTVSKQLADDLQRLAVEIGVSTTVAIRDVDGFARQYNLRFGHSGRMETAVRVGRNVSPKQYSGLVWCLTVPTGAYFVRRNGRVAVSGNSAAWFNKCDHGIIVHRESENVTKVVIAKSRFEEAGVRGVVKYSFDKATLSLDYLDRGDQGADVLPFR